MSVLVLSWDRVGARMAGPAIRAVEIAHALAARDHEVVLAAPEGSVLLPTERGPRLATFTRDQGLDRLLDSADVSIVPGRVELMAAVHRPLVVDLYDPFVLSNLDFFGDRFDRSGGRALLALRWLEQHLRNGDYFVCASETQRSFWLGMLTAAGRVNHANYVGDPHLERLLGIVPFGIPDAPPVAAGEARVRGVVPGVGRDDQVVAWAGGLWNWVDPLTLVRAMAEIRRRRSDVTALILGTRHPNPEIGEMEVARAARALAVELGVEGRGVSFVEWVPYDERGAWLLECAVGVSLHRPGVESEFAFRTRLLDYVWAGLPMVLTGGDELADRFGRAGLAEIVAPGDPAALAAAIERTLDETGGPARRAAAFAAMRASLAWSRAVEPLDAFCREPRRAPDRERNAWVAPPRHRGDLPPREAALMVESFWTDARALSSPLRAEYTLCATFRAARDGLCQIEVLPQVEGEIFGLLELELSSEENSVVARVAVPGAEVARRGWQVFRFRPEEHSRDRRYSLALRWRPDPDLPWWENGKISLWLSPPPEGAECEGDGVAFMARYLIAGIAAALPVQTEDWVLLHGSALRTDGPAPIELGRAAAALPTPESLEVGRLRAALAETQARLRALEERTALLDPQELRATVVEIASPAGEEAGRRAAREGPLGVLRADLRWRLRGTLGRVRALLQRTVGRALLLGLVLAQVPLVFLVATALALFEIVAWPRRRRALAAAEPERSARADDPVSVVIPTWNGRELLERGLPPLLRALELHGHPADEIVVVDNGSDDGTVEWLEAACARHAALRFVALPVNDGFAGATNRGAREARNPILVLLNNDMVVEEDFLPLLVEPFASEPRLFGVSAQIDFIDKNKPRWETGKVHARLERGRVRLFHLDRFDEDRFHPVFFAGGGASAYDRERFLLLGGFDEAVFSPVYIEDVDLGYRAWRRGWPSVMAPRSRVHHEHRGTTRRLWSEGTIHSFFVKNLAALLWKNVTAPRLLARHVAGLVVLPVLVRREKGLRAAIATQVGLLRQLPATLHARWWEAAIRPALGDGEVFTLSRWRHVYQRYFHPGERDPSGRPQVLVVAPYSPAPPVHGGATRMLALLREMGRRCDVTLISFHDTPAEIEPASLAQLREVCRDVVLLPRQSWTAGGPLAPHSTAGFFSPALDAEIEAWLGRRPFEVVQVEYTHMAHCLPAAAPGLVRVLVEHDIATTVAARARAAEPSRLRRLRLRVEEMRALRHEVRAVERADVVLTMSEVDRQTLAQWIDPRSIHVVPNGVSCEEFTPAVASLAQVGDAPSLLFVGFFRHPPNVEAVHHLVRDILPRVRERVPGVRLRIVGAYPPSSVLALATGDPLIEVTGRVAQVAPFYRSATVFVAPILKGSGTRLKILEAMASGCPVVSTTLGAEGLVAGAEEIMVADGPSAFADAVALLLLDPARRAAQAAAARRLACENYDWPAVAETLFRAWGWPRSGPAEIPSRRVAARAG